MTRSQTVAGRLIDAVAAHSGCLAIAGEDGRRLTYGDLGRVAASLADPLAATRVVGIYAAPGAAMAASAVACVLHGRPFVHLDPAMPQMVLHNVIAELEVSLILMCAPAPPGHLPAACRTLDAAALLNDLGGGPAPSLRSPDVSPGDPIYLVATSGTTGRPKCIPVSQDAAHLSYEWRDAYTPYAPGMRVGIYIFAIWEMFRPLRDGAELWFPAANTLMDPRGLARFLAANRIGEMLFTPSFYETFLAAIGPADLPLSRVVLNGEVVSDALIEASLAALPDTQLWNLYSICETHDVCMTRLVAPARGPAPVGVPMEHLRAVILGEDDRPVPAGETGQLHFIGPRMLGLGYVNRPEETRLRFRELEIDGRRERLYDTGDAGWLDDGGALHIVGRIAHMLKLRGNSIQTRELTETLRGQLAFSQGVPWVADVGGRPALIFYLAADGGQARANADRWGIGPGANRIPAALAADLRAVLPAYCVPSHVVQLDAIPLHPVSGKTDLRALPPVAAEARAPAGEDAVVAAAAAAMGCAPGAVDPSLSFHDQGGDSLMCVAFMTDLGAAYGRPVEFELAMTVPLHRLDQLMTREADAAAPTGGYGRPGLLLTGATGFLGGHVLARAARDLPPGHVVYCLVRDKRRGARDRLGEVAARHGVDPARLVMVPGTLDAPLFGLDPADHAALAASVASVVHCAAMVNMAIGEAEMLDWSRRGINAVLAFCRAAGADLRFTSSSAVFPDRGGPCPEGPAERWEGCTGYGAAKIAAEAMIAASGVPAAIVRLPSLYDLDAPNPRDIYEIVLAASARAGVWPEGLTFPMTEVGAAAAILLGPVDGGAAYLNLMAPTPVAPEGTMPPADWRAAVDLPPGIARVLDEYPDTLRANAAFETAAARAAWARVSDAPYASLCDPAALLARRIASYQGEPAFTG